MRRWLLALGLGVCVGTVPLAAQMTPLAKMRCTAATYPNCGMGAIAENSYHTRRLLVGAGPNGIDAVEFIQLATSQGAQYYMGWGANTGVTASLGATRYLRAKVRFPTPFTPSWSAKYIILGDGTGDGSRVICQLRDNGMTVNSMAVDCMKGINGYPEGTRLVELSLGPWHSFQAEVRSGSGNAQIKLWVDAAPYESPSSISGLFSLNTSNWQAVGVGYYAGTNPTSTNHTALQMSDFEFDDQYDPNWHTGGGAPIPPPTQPVPPADPVNLHLLTSGLISAVLVRRVLGRRS